MSSITRCASCALRVGEEVELFDRAGNAARGTVQSARPRQRRRSSPASRCRRASRRWPCIWPWPSSSSRSSSSCCRRRRSSACGRSSRMVTERMELRPERYAGKRERWEKIVFEAVKQSGRARRAAHRRAAAVCDRSSRRDRHEDSLRCRRGTVDASSARRTVTLLIGPEGGWTEEELRAAREARLSLPAPRAAAFARGNGGHRGDVRHRLPLRGLVVDYASRWPATP